jgi:SP family sugar:H+ symporter-like MFS transporter
MHNRLTTFISFVYFFVPELAGKSLDEIDMMFHQGIALRSFGKEPHMDMEAKAESGEYQDLKAAAVHVEAKEARASSSA